MVKLLIFDLDGTLIHSAPDIIASTNELMAARGRPPLSDEVITAAIGEGVKQLVFSLFPETHSSPQAMQALENEFVSIYEKNLLNQTDVFPGVLEFLDRSRETLAIVTNKRERLALKTVNGLRLKNYDWLRIYGADSLPNRKPDPLPLLEVIKAAGVAREEAVMIGDGIPDMIAARRAGVHSIAISFGYTQPEILRAQGASLLLDSYSSLDEAIREIGRLPPREVAPA